MRMKELTQNKMIMPPELWQHVFLIQRKNRFIEAREKLKDLEFPVKLASHGNYYLLKSGKHHWAVEGGKVCHYLKLDRFWYGLILNVAI